LLDIARVFLNFARTLAALEEVPNLASAPALCLIPKKIMPNRKQNQKRNLKKLETGIII